MTAGVPALRDDNIGTRIGGFLGLSEGLHLADDFASGGLDSTGEGSGVAERQHYRRGSGIERHLESCRIAFERPGNEANADPSVARLTKLGADRRYVGLARADHTEAAGVGDGGGKFPTGCRSHRR